MRYIYIIIIFMLIVCPSKIKSANGPDAVRAGLFLKYSLIANKILMAEDAAMSVNLAQHKYLEEQNKKIINFQKEFDNYLTSFNDILTLAADIYGIYYEIDQAFSNIKELKNIGSKCPTNVIAVLLSGKKNNIYQDVIDDGIQIATDIEKILPFKGKSKKPRLTQYEKMKIIENIRKRLRVMNYKIRKMNRTIRYTTLLDSWYELQGSVRGTKSMKTIVTECKNRWLANARTVNKQNCEGKGFIIWDGSWMNPFDKKYN